MKNFEQIRKTLRYHREISAATPPHYYGVDYTDASIYFGPHEKWGRKIRNFFSELHDKGEKVVHVDICGRASGRSLGADRSYCFYIMVSETDKMISGSTNVLFDGDIFDSRNFNKFLSTLRQDSTAPSLVTFRPVAGLQNYSPIHAIQGVPMYEEITYRQLAKRLEGMVEILRPGGYIFLQHPFQSEVIDNFLSGKKQNQWGISLRIKGLARKCKCRIEINSAPAGPCFLVNKPKRQG